MVVSLRNEVNKFSSALAMSSGALVNELELIIAENNGEAMEIAMAKLQGWLSLQVR